MSTTAQQNCNNFPGDPQHGDIYEAKPGLLYQWDAGASSWIEIVSSSVNLPLATPIREGIMSSVDLQKINRLVLPPPQSTLVGNDCLGPFQRGTLEFLSGDNYVDVQGNLDIRNIDEFGDTISQSHAFHIHQHTYGFDFTLDLPRLIQTLISRDQILLKGRVGNQGQKGDTGDAGIDEILTGDQGAQGEQGFAPECTLSIDPEPISAEKRPGLKRALVKARVVPDTDDETKYTFEFDRQVVGTEDASTSQFNAKNSDSYWILAVGSVAGTPQAVYYLDVDPIIEVIRQKYLDEVDRCKKGYEDIVEFWIQTMSDLFDEQKSALCCSLEYCMSVRKSIDQRQHMEAVAASAIGDQGAKIKLHGRHSGESVEVSSTRTLKRMPEGSDLCDNGTPFPQRTTASAEAVEVEESTPKTITIDPLLNVATIKTAATMELPKGRYTATIQSMSTRISGMYGVTAKIQYADNGAKKAVQFLDKGRFDSLTDAKNAYEGLSLAFNHDGGDIYVYLPILPNPDSSGNTVISIDPAGFAPPEPEPEPLVEEPKSKPKRQRTPEKVEAVGVRESQFVCTMSASHLHWYKAGWESDKCCGLVTSIGGQDYIVFKRSIGDDEACGGGESDSTPCLASAKEILGQHPAFAWPTFDGKTFAPISGESIMFRYDEAMSQAVQQNIDKSDYDSPKGSPAGYRHLAHQLSVILFPAT